MSVGPRRLEVMTIEEPALKLETDFWSAASILRLSIASLTADELSEWPATATRPAVHGV